MTASPFPTSPLPLDEALAAMDGLYAPSVLRPATVGLDPFAIRDDPAALLADVDPDRLMADVRRLARPRGPGDTEGRAAAAELVVDSFGDSGYRVHRSDVEGRPAAGSGQILAVQVEGRTCPERVLVVTTTYAGPDESPGAWAASGTAALLEVARVLAERPQAPTVELQVHPDPVGEVAEVRVEGHEDAEVVAGLVLEGVGVVDASRDDDGLVGLAPVSLHLVGEAGSEYLARVVTLATGRFMPSFWAFTSVADLDVFPEFADRSTQPWWDTGYQALLVTDTGPRRDERIGTDEDLPAIVDRDLLVNATRSVLTSVVGVAAIDTDDDLVPDVCQREW